MSWTRRLHGLVSRWPAEVAAAVLAVLVVLVAAAGVTMVAADAAAAAGGAPLVVVDSVVRGHTNVPRDKVCVLNSRFLHGEQIVWRAKVIDPASGEPMDDSQLVRVWIELADGQVFEAHYGGHPGNNPVDWYWTVAWEIPEGYPTGILDYTIYAEAQDGRMGESVKFPIESSMLTILPGSVL